MLGASLALVALLASCGGGERAKRPTTSAPRAPLPAPVATPPLTTNNLGRASAGSSWSYAKLVASLSGRTLALPGGRVRLDGSLLVCNGRGASVGGGSARRWGRYTCTQTLFQGGVDRDVTFDVAILSAAQLKITAARYGPQ
jgi:hypothetical protein